MMLTPPLGLLTDLYQLTMAAGYLDAGKADREAVFHLFYRRNPFGGGYAVACGLQQVKCVRDAKAQRAVRRAAGLLQGLSIEQVAGAGD